MFLDGESPTLIGRGLSWLVHFEIRYETIERNNYFFHFYDIISFAENLL